MKPKGSTRSRGVRIALRIIAAIVTVVVTIALVRAIIRDGPAALEAWREAEVRWTWISLSIVCGLGAHAALIVGWRRLLLDGGIPITWLQTARLLLVSNLGRYLPAAKAWQMGIIGIIAAENGLPAARIAASSLFYGLVGVAVGAILLVGTGGAILGIHPVWSAVPLAGLAALVAAPPLLRSIPRLWDAVLSRFPGVESVTAGTMWALVWTCALNWVAWGIGLYALALGLLPRAGASLTAYVAAWIGPFLAGVAAVVTPGGLGVREEVMRTMLVGSGAEASAAIVVVVVARLWSTALDVIPAVAFFALRRKGPGAPPARGADRDDA